MEKIHKGEGEAESVLTLGVGGEQRRLVTLSKTQEEAPVMFAERPFST